MGSAGKDDQIIDPVVGSLAVTPANATIAEGVHRREKYSLLVRIFTTQDRRSLKPLAWVEDLLKDFFQSILGTNLSVILLIPTECLIFCGNCTQGQGMSWNKSLCYAHQLTGVHPWTGYMIEVVALQRTLKETHHKMQVAREFTHERTKQRIAHLNTIAVVPAVKAQPVMPQRSPRGWGMTRRANQFFMQQQLKELNLNEPAFMHCPPCWPLDWGLQSTNNLTPPMRMPWKMRSMPRVHWMPNLMPAWARRPMPQGAGSNALGQ